MEGGGLAFFIVLGLASLGVVIWAVVDASSRPDWAWQQSGQSKGLWIALPIVLLLLCGIVGGILAIVYLTSIRPQVMAAEGTGGPYRGGAYGGPPGGYGSPPPGPSGPYGSPPAGPSGPYDSPPAPPPPPSSGPPADPFGG